MNTSNVMNIISAVYVYFNLAIDILLKLAAIYVVFQIRSIANSLRKISDQIH